MDSRVRLAFGGVFATLNAELVKLQCPEVDFVCRGDGEQLILDLLERLNDPCVVAGLTWAKDGDVDSVIRTEMLDRNLDQWPFPDRESLPLDFVESMPLDVPAVLSMERFTTMQTSRGCPWPCVFCDIPIFNEGKWRSRTPQHVIDEFKQLQKMGYGSVYFVDDHFLLQPKRIEAICKGLNRCRHQRSNGAAKVGSIRRHSTLFPAMAKAHCRTIMFGVESGSQKVLDRLKERSDAGAGRKRGRSRQRSRHRDRARVFCRWQPGRDRRRYARDIRLCVASCGSIPSASTVCVSTVAHHYGRSTCSAAWLTMPPIGTSISNARRSIPPACRADDQ